MSTGEGRPPQATSAAATPQGAGPLSSLGRLHSLPGLQWREPADCSNPGPEPSVQGLLSGPLSKAWPAADMQGWARTLSAALW